MNSWHFARYPNNHETESSSRNRRGRSDSPLNVETSKHAFERNHDERADRPVARARIVRQVSSRESTFDLNSLPPSSSEDARIPLLCPVSLPRPAAMSETFAPIHFSLSPSRRLASNRLIGFISPLRRPTHFAPSFFHSPRLCTCTR